MHFPPGADKSGLSVRVKSEPPTARGVSPFWRAAGMIDVARRPVRLLPGGGFAGQASQDGTRLAGTHTA
jgi:hypothetical protein